MSKEAAAVGAVAPLGQGSVCGGEQGTGTAGPGHWQRNGSWQRSWTWEGSK